MEMATAYLVFQVVNAGANLGIGAWLYMEKRNDKASVEAAVEAVKTKVLSDVASAADANDARLDDHGERIVALETRIDVAPTHDDLGKIHEKINEANEGISGLSGELKGVSRTLGTIHEHLLRTK